MESCTGSGGGGGIAVRAGGTGDVTKSHTVWIGQQTGRIGSPLFYDDRIYSISRGIAHCFDASAGDQIFRGRLKATTKVTTPSSSTGTGSVSSAEESQSQRGGGRRRGSHGGQDYSSFVLADGKIYFASRSGDIHVLEAGKDFKQLAVNRVTGESEDFSAAPAISQGELYIRSSKNLYCIAQLEERVNLRVAVKAERESQKKLQNGKQEAAASETPIRPGRQGGFGGGRFDLVAIFKRSDTDSDGKLSGDEISGRLKDNLKQIDTDQDEVISLDEFQSGMRAMFRRGGRGRSGRNVRQGRPERPQRPALSFID